MAATERSAACPMSRRNRAQGLPRDGGFTLIEVAVSLVLIILGTLSLLGLNMVVLEAQQASIHRHPGARLVTLGIDAGGAHARRLMARAVEDSAAG